MTYENPATRIIGIRVAGLCIAGCKGNGRVPRPDREGLPRRYRAPLGKSTTPIVLKIMFMSSRMDIFLM